MSGVTEEEIDKFETAFYGEKAQGRHGGEGGHLTLDRLKRWCSVVGVQAEDARLQELCQNLNSGRIDFQALLKHLASSIPVNTDPELLKVSFQAFDQDRNGKITRDEIKALLRNLEDRPTEQDIDDMIKMLDTNNDGEIDYDEFVKLMTS